MPIDQPHELLQLARIVAVKPMPQEIEGATRQGHVDHARLLWMQRRHVLSAPERTLLSAPWLLEPDSPHRRRLVCAITQILREIADFVVVASCECIHRDVVDAACAAVARDLFERPRQRLG